LSQKRRKKKDKKTPLLDLFHRNTDEGFIDKKAESTDSGSPLRKRGLAKCQWLTPIILGTWEAEIKRIAVKASTDK
jgi:hypothetical protein